MSARTTLNHSRSKSRPRFRGRLPLDIERLKRLAWLSGGRAVAVMLSLASIIVLASMLNPSQIGTWSILVALQSYALQISEHGLRTVTMAEAGRPGQTPQRLLPSYLKSRLVISAITYGVAVTVTWLLMPSWIAPVALIMTSIFAIAAFVDWIYLVDDRPAAAGMLLLVRPGFFLAALLITPLILSSGEFSVLILALLFSTSWIVAAAISWSVPDRRRDDKVAHDITVAAQAADRAPQLSPSKLVRAGRPIMFSQLIGQAMVNLDLIVVGAVLGLATAGHYFLAASMATACLVIANAAGQIANARLGRVILQPARFNGEVVHECRYLAWIATAFTIVVSLFSETAIDLFFGNDYAPSAGLLVLMLPWLWIAHQSALLQAALAVRRQQDRLLKISLQAAMIMLMGLMASSVLQAAMAFAILRGVTEASRYALLIRQFPALARRQMLAEIAIPAFAAMVAIYGALAF